MARAWALAQAMAKAEALASAVAWALAEAMAQAEALAVAKTMALAMAKAAAKALAVLDLIKGRDGDFPCLKILAPEDGRRAPENLF
jgi:hypothetical protein